MNPGDARWLPETLTHLSCLLSFSAFLVRDMLWLRFLAIGSSIVWVAAMASGSWSAASFFWNTIFVAINVFNIVALVRENRAVAFTEEEQELYETLFRHFKPGEFLKILRVAQRRSAPPGEALLVEGAPVEGVGLILEGELEVLIQNQLRAVIGELDLFGEMGYLSGDPASGTVKTRTPVRYLWWPVKALESFFLRHPSLRGGCHSVITNDLRKKLLRNAGEPPCSGAPCAEP